MNAMPNPVSADPKQDLADPFAGSAFSGIERLGAGGMGEVHLVLHRELGREFVAKLLHARYATDRRMLDRVRVEAQALGKLNHPHIVSVTGFGTSRDGRPFIVMEHLRGRTLAAELAARGALPPAEAVSYTLQLLAALEAAHSLGIIHRDIKPENLFLTERAGGQRALQVLDFGLARVLPGMGGAAPMPLALPTNTGHIIGTPHFVSPEGALGKKVDERADLYAAGLVLYTLLAGRGPFDGMKRAADILAAHANVEPPAPSVLAGISLPSALDELVLFALRKDPNQRFQGARLFSCALAQLEGPLSNYVPEVAHRANAKPRLVRASLTSSRFFRLVVGRWRLLAFAAIATLTAVLVSRVVRIVLERSP